MKAATTKTAKTELTRLSKGQVKILAALAAAKTGGSTGKQIAEATGMDPSGFCTSISQALRRRGDREWRHRKKARNFTTERNNTERSRISEYGPRASSRAGALWQFVIPDWWSGQRA
jgi:hypothetical protein